MASHRTNADRVYSAERALDAYFATGAGDTDDRHSTIGDLMADLLHYAHAHDSVDAVAVLHERAWRHFRDEKDDPGEEGEGADFGMLRYPHGGFPAGTRVRWTPSNEPRTYLALRVTLPDGREKIVHDDDVIREA